MLKDAKMSIKSAERSHFLPELYFESLWEEDLNSLRKELNLKPVGNLYPPTKRLNAAVKVPV
jgi:ubiquinone biosynthesis protein Coq4